MLKVDGLTCGYGHKVIISAISLHVKSGEFFGLIGPNGSGKTTLLRALSREIAPMNGAVLIARHSKTGAVADATAPLSFA